MNSFLQKKTICLNKIYDDLREIVYNPIEGVNIILNEDPMEMKGSIKLIDGNFKDFIINLMIKFSFDYPIIPPKLLIYPSQLIILYHSGIYKSKEYENFYEFDIQIQWNKNDTLRRLLLQCQKYLSEPKIKELPENHEINKLINNEDIFRMENAFINKESIKNDVINGNNYIEKKEIYKRNNNVDLEIDNEDIKINENREEGKDNLAEIDELENEELEDEEIIEKDESSLIIENERFEISKNFIIKNDLTCFESHLNYEDNPDLLLGYKIGKLNDGNFVIYIQMISKQAYEEQNLDKKKYLWLPMYINKEHFQKNVIGIYRNQLENTIELLPKILVILIINILERKSYLESLIKCIFHFILLFKNIFIYFKKQFNKYIINILDKKKKLIKDKNHKIKNVSNIHFLIELLILLLFDNDPNSKKYEILNNILIIIRKRIMLETYKYNPDFNMINNELLIKDLTKLGIYDKILDIIISDKNINNNGKISKNLRKKIIKQLNENFRELYNKCDANSKNKMNEIFYDKINICDYFNLEKYIKNNFYESNNVSLLIYFYMIKKQINECYFFEKLEENYGVFLDSYKFYNIKKINNIYEFKEYIADNCYNNIIIDILILKELSETEKKIESNIKEKKILKNKSRFDLNNKIEKASSFAIIEENIANHFYKDNDIVKNKFKINQSNFDQNNNDDGFNNIYDKFNINNNNYYKEEEKNSKDIIRNELEESILSWKSSFKFDEDLGDFYEEKYNIIFEHKGKKKKRRIKKKTII